MDNFYQKGIYPSVYKVIAIGDLHGDWKATLLSLKKGKIIDDKLNWIAGKTHVVQLGDILDRKIRNYEGQNDENSEFKIMNLFIRLQKQAYKSGGAFHCIIGNHELMNIMGQFDYVSKLGFKNFKGPIGRKIFFKPGGKICKLLAKSWNPVIRIGKFLFMHGGMSLKISKKYNIKSINNLMRMFLKGKKNIIRTSHFKELFINSNSILWNRQFSNQPYYKIVDKVLKNKNASFMVLGHTPQQQGINLKCNKVWCVDTGMSEAFGKRINNDRIQILEIIRNGKTVNIK